MKVLLSFVMFLCSIFIQTAQLNAMPIRTVEFNDDSLLAPPGEPPIPVNGIRSEGTRFESAIIDDIFFPGFSLFSTTSGSFLATPEIEATFQQISAPLPLFIVGDLRGDLLILFDEPLIEFFSVSSLFFSPEEGRSFPDVIPDALKITMIGQGGSSVSSYEADANFEATDSPFASVQTDDLCCFRGQSDEFLVNGVEISFNDSEFPDGTEFAIERFSYGVSVPEPPTMLLLATGIVGIAVSRLRRKKKWLF